VEDPLNYYKRYPADYGKKTARLTLAQHGAYTLLLDELYTTEQGLPADFVELYRICRAMDKAEQAAVRFVADLHFPIASDGLRHNGRASEEIAEAAPAIEAARLNGKKGGRPRKQTQEKPSGFSVDNQEQTQDEPGSKAPHSSDTSASLRSAEGRASRLPKPFELPVEWADWAKAERPDLDPQRVADKFADYWHGKGGAAARKLDWLATWRNWVREERAPAASRQSFGAPKHAGAAAAIFDMDRQEVIDA
jgi:uncharacterized protein YdaU (DUF1376 family)